MILDPIIRQAINQSIDWKKEYLLFDGLTRALKERRPLSKSFLIAFLGLELSDWCEDTDSGVPNVAENGSDWRTELFSDDSQSKSGFYQKKVQTIPWDNTEMKTLYVFECNVFNHFLDILFDWVSLISRSIGVFDWLIDWLIDWTGRCRTFRASHEKRPLSRRLLDPEEKLALALDLTKHGMLWLMLYGFGSRSWRNSRW